MPRAILTVAAIAFTVSVPGLAEELLTLSWDATAPLSGMVGEDGVLVVTNDTGGPMTAALAEIQEPGITASWYALHGTVSYEGVGGIGFLEMWSVFPDGSAFFSRTLADFGPLRRITGSSKRREFGLPFSLGDATERPEILTFNLMLPQAGTVKIGPIRLVQYASEQSLHQALAADGGAK